MSRPSSPVADWRSYDAVAETYERIHARRFRDPAQDLVAMASPGPGARVLDVGTGTGVAAEIAAETVGGTGAVVGIDASIGMLAVARRVRPQIRLVAAEVIDLPFHNSTFDLAVGNFVLAHFTKYQTALYDILRVLRGGGTVAVTTWADGPDDLQNAWREIVETAVPREMLDPALAQAAPWHERFRQRAAVEEALIDAGLRHVRTEVRRYRFVYGLDEYLEGLGTWATGRFVRGMLGEQAWQALLEQARATFAARFADPVNDFREVLLAVGTKP
jgi:ubiquinone/menaquinone biosynthesis C-methylase UbiE